MGFSKSRIKIGFRVENSEDRSLRILRKILGKKILRNKRNLREIMDEKLRRIVDLELRAL